MRSKALAVLLSLLFIKPLLADTTGNRSILSGLDPAHPRLLLKEDRLTELRRLADRDQILQRYVNDILTQANAYMGAGPLQYEKIGPRLLHVSRACLDRVYALGLAWRWTARQAFADKAIEQILTVCNFQDWNPSHFLDTAEMSHAVGIGYDWLYHCMDQQTRDQIRMALIAKGLKPALEAYDNNAWWVRSEFNWNQVCNGGMIIASLAIADSDPCYAERIIPAAIESLPIALKTYGPDGAWPEGPGYWGYATSYTAYGIAALVSGLGTDFGLLGTQGLAQSGAFPIYITGPTGLYLNFADCGERSRRNPMPCLFWLATVYPQMELYAWSEHQVLTRARARASAGHLIWYVPHPDRPRLDLDRYFRGPVEVAVFRSSWQDPNALFVGVKAGYNQVNHGHLDLGNFELDALGVRWARDLGSDNYNLPGYWDSKRSGRRWAYYRLRSVSHNVVTLADTDQDPEGAARFIRVQTNGQHPLVVVDLTSAYRAHANSALRGVRLVDNRKAVLIQDELDIKTIADLTWGMTTDASIQITQPDTAMLQLQGRRMIAKILWPKGAGFDSSSAEQQPPQARNTAVNRLLVRLPSAQGQIRLAVLLSPLWDGGAVQQVQISPLDQW